MTPFVKITIDATGEDLTDYVESMKFEDSMKKANVLEFTVRPERAIEMLNKKEISEQKGTEFTVQYGFLGGTVSLNRKVKLVDLEAEYSVKLKLLLRCMDKGNVMKKVTSNYVWKNMTSVQIAQAIATTHGLSLVADQTEKVWDNMPQANMSDFELLKYLANREKDGKFYSYVIDDTLYFVQDALDEPSMLTYTYGADERMISFKPRYRKAGRKGKDGALGMAKFDELKKKVAAAVNGDTTKDETLLGNNRIQFNNQGLRTSGGGLRQVVEDLKTAKSTIDSSVVQMKKLGTDMDSGGAGIQKLLNAPTAMGDDEISNLSNSSTKKGGKKVLTANLTVVGNPALKPNTIITVSGVADRHSGNWLVEKVTHKVDNGKYLTELDLNKNGISKKDGAPKTDKKVNNTVGDKEAKQQVRIYFDNQGNRVNKRPGGLNQLRNELLGGNNNGQ